MLDNQNQSQMTGGSEDVPIISGTPVFDASGEKLGDVSEHEAERGYLVVHKGFLFPKDIFVPVSAIARKTTDGIVLNLDKRQIQDQGWDQPPERAGDGRTGTSSGMAHDRDIRDGDDMGDTGAMGSTTGTDMTGDDQVAGSQGRSAREQHATPPREGDVAVPVREEELDVRKQPREAGRAHVRKDVEEQQQTLNVPVTREEVTVEHVPTQGRADAAPDAFTEQDIDIPVMGEEVQTEKRAKVKDELHLRKRPVSDTQQVSDTVRKERVNVEGADEQGRLPRDGGGEDTTSNLP